MTSDRDVMFRIATPRTAGAIAIFELIGTVDSLIARLARSMTGGALSIQNGHLVLASLVEDDATLIDTGVIGRVNDRFAMLMVHGGPRVVQRLRDRLIALGARRVSEADDDPRVFWPEASSVDEALMLGALSRAHSRDAIDLLATQPARWKRFRLSDASRNAGVIARIRERSRWLNRLITPPVVVVVGPPNVGKSTLTNTLVGRSASIESELAGTTRDYVAVLVDLSGLTVWWYDTPGRRETADSIEREAIRISDQVLASADLVIQASSVDIPEIDGASQRLPRSPDLRIVLKADAMADGPEAPRLSAEIDLAVSSRSGFGIEELARTVRDWLVPREALEADDPWLFDDRLLVISDSTRD